MTVSEFIEKLKEYPPDMEVVMLSEITGNFVRVRAEPRHIRVMNPGEPPLLRRVKGVWSPMLDTQRPEQKGEEVLVLW